MSVTDLATKNRSYRRFDQSIEIDDSTLLEIANLSRLGGSAANMQPIRYYLSNKPDTNEKIFKTLKWAGYLERWNGPEEGEKPTAYIVMLTEFKKSKYVLCDAGIAAQTMLLGSVEKGLGGCIFGSIERDELMESLKLSPDYEILLIIALGKPVEQVEIVDAVNENIKYFRDEDKVHYVPKLKFDTLVLNSEDYK